MSDAPLPPGVLRRKQLRQEKRADLLRHLWQLTVFSALSTGLVYLLLREGWILRQPSQVEVVGSSVVNRDQVIQAAGLRFPQPLLKLKPKELGLTLAEALPVQQVKVSRLMLPPRLRVELVDREAVARAERRTSAGVEQGYVDQVGNWINTSHDHGVHIKGSLNLRVIGWQDRHRPALARVLAARKAIDPGLEEIRFDPDGSLWLTTRDLGSLRLGPSDSRLDRQLDVVAHLNRTLPEQVKGRRPRMIDLTDPEQPELSLPGPASPAQGRASVSAPPPQGTR